MRHLEEISEAEMVATFLRGEIASERFGPKILQLLERDGRCRRVVEQPNIKDLAENAYRKQLLGDFRGYAQDRDHFESFPNDVAWHRCLLSKQELGEVLYIDYSYWNELSEGSRKPSDGARSVREGRVVFGKTNERYWRVVDALRRGAKLPEMILVGIGPGAPLVVLEGHLRITAYFVSPEYLPDELSAIVGFSPGITRWLALPPWD